jgi:hypothetical protein
MKPDLIGYALNALEADERLFVEQYLAGSLAAREELAAIQATLQPLGHDQDIDSPPYLVADTLKRIAAYRCRRVSSLRESIAPARPRRSLGFSWRHADALVAAGILLVLCMLVPPALLYVRHREGVMACAENLHRFHTALAQYSQDNNGFLPRPERAGPYSAAAVYTVALRDAGYWDPMMQTSCPGNRGAHQQVPPPTLDQLNRRIQSVVADPETVRHVYESLGGCYGYHLGYEEEGQFMGIRRNLGDNVPVMADRPPRDRETPDWRLLNSPNHSGLGQNVLYLGGHVRFMRARIVDSDDIYLNGMGRLAVGQGSRDAVLGPGEAKPYPDQD